MFNTTSAALPNRTHLKNTFTDVRVYLHVLLVQYIARQILEYYQGYNYGLGYYHC